MPAGGLVCYPMHFDLAHFPDFQEGFFGISAKRDVLEMLIDIREQLDCLHITHIGYSNQTAPNKGSTPDVSVTTTLPFSWAMRYSAKVITSWIRCLMPWLCLGALPRQQEAYEIWQMKSPCHPR